MGRHALQSESEISAHIARVLATEDEEDREAAVADYLLEDPLSEQAPPDMAADIALVVAGLILTEQVTTKAGDEVKLAFSLDTLLGKGVNGLAATAQSLEELLFKAIYAQNAFRRLLRADNRKDAFQRERRFHASHLHNSQRRISAARMVDAASREYGIVLGWRAVLDDSTTSECRHAHAKNFRADRRPAIGYPGAVHGWCRCAPGPPVPGAALLT